MDNKKELFCALSKAQNEFGAIEKDKEVTIKSSKGSYSYRYATLATILRAVQPALSKHELGIHSKMQPSEHGTELTTLLFHSSGETQQSSIFLPHTNDPKQFGGLVSYYTRYFVMGLLGIAADDLDADEAPEPKRDPLWQPILSRILVNGQAIFNSDKGYDRIASIEGPDQFKLFLLLDSWRSKMGHQWRHDRHEENSKSKFLSEAQKHFAANSPEAVAILANQWISKRVQERKESLEAAKDNSESALPNADHAERSHGASIE